jgi:DNA-binding NarL/FixJ family response regulator
VLSAQAVREIAAGRSWFDNALIQQLAQRNSLVEGDSGSKGLTNREREILRRVVEGKSNKEIGGTSSDFHKFCKSNFPAIVQ